MYPASAGGLRRFRTHHGDGDKADHDSDHGRGRKHGYGCACSDCAPRSGGLRRFRRHENLEAVPSEPDGVFLFSGAEHDGDCECQPCVILVLEMAADLGDVADDSEVQAQSYAAQADAANSSASTLEARSREHDKFAEASTHPDVKEHHKKRSEELKTKADALKKEAVHAREKAEEHHKAAKEAKKHADAVTKDLGKGTPATPTATPTATTTPTAAPVAGGRFRRQFKHSYYW